MNIFATDLDPRRSAEFLCNRHVVKMVLETAQLLSGALRMHGVDDDRLYRLTHKNHPCSIWTRTDRTNFMWLVEHGLALSAEYSRRYRKTHKSLAVIEAARSLAHRIPAGDGTPFAMAMPEQFHTQIPTLSYRAYLASKYQSWTEAGRPPRYS